MIPTIEATTHGPSNAPSEALTQPPSSAPAIGSIPPRLLPSLPPTANPSSDQAPEPSTALPSTKSSNTAAEPEGGTSGIPTISSIVRPSAEPSLSPTERSINRHENTQPPTVVPSMRLAVRLTITPTRSPGLLPTHEPSHSAPVSPIPNSDPRAATTNWPSSALVLTDSTETGGAITTPTDPLAMTSIARAVTTPSAADRVQGILNLRTEVYLTSNYFERFSEGVAVVVCDYQSAILEEYGICRRSTTVTVVETTYSFLSGRDRSRRRDEPKVVRIEFFVSGHHSRAVSGIIVVKALTAATAQTLKQLFIYDLIGALTVADILAGDELTARAESTVSTQGSVGVLKVTTLVATTSPVRVDDGGGEGDNENEILVIIVVVASLLVIGLAIVLTYAYFRGGKPDRAGFNNAFYREPSLGWSVADDGYPTVSQAYVLNEATAPTQSGRLALDTGRPDDTGGTSAVSPVLDQVDRWTRESRPGTHAAESDLAAISNWDAVAQALRASANGEAGSNLEAELDRELQQVEWAAPKATDGKRASIAWVQHVREASRYDDQSQVVRTLDTKLASLLAPHGGGEAEPPLWFDYQEQTHRPSHNTTQSPSANNGGGDYLQFGSPGYETARLPGDDYLQVGLPGYETARLPAGYVSTRPASPGNDGYLTSIEPVVDSSPESLPR